MKAIRLVTMSAVVVASLGFAPAALAYDSTIVEDTIELVRDRVCTDEHGYGVIDCSQEVDPYVQEVKDRVGPVVSTAVDTAKMAVEEAEKVPGIAEETVEYVVCWMVYPEDPYCQD